MASNFCTNLGGIAGIPENDRRWLGVVEGVVECGGGGGGANGWLGIVITDESMGRQERVTWERLVHQILT